MVGEKELEKPKFKTKIFYHYNECRNYLQKKYNCNERDFAGRYKRDENNKLKEVDINKPYQDFWHWVCDNYIIYNGCFIVFSKNYFGMKSETIPEWVKTIYSRYIEEFADNNGELVMFCEW